MIPIYIIDGYNVIYDIPELKALLDESLERARQQLETYLRAYLSRKRVKITLVYDGDTPVPLAVPRSRGKLKIIFSRAPQKADAIIMNLVHKQRQPQGLTVVTNDNEIIRQAKGHQANSMSPQDFLALVHHPTESDTLEQKYDSNMSEQELAEWLEIFQNSPKNTEENRDR